MSAYGKELILDIHSIPQCATLCSRKVITNYVKRLCDLIKMERCKLTFWDYHWWPNWVIRWMKWDKDDKVFGSSAVQFIRTSNITIHIIPNLKKVYVNIFSCKDFEEDRVIDFTREFFKGTIANQYVLERW